MTIAELNRIITIKPVQTGKNAKGIPVKVAGVGKPTYASFQVVTNSYTLEQAQVTFGELWEAKLRWEPSRIVQLNDVIAYQDNNYTINSIVRKNEGNLEWVIIRCTFNNHSGQTNGGDIMYSFKEIHVKGDVVIGGADYTNWTGSIIAFRDGTMFEVVRNTTPIDKQINYNVSTGLFNYPADLMPLQPLEPTDIYLL